MTILPLIVISGVYIFRKRHSQILERCPLLRLRDTCNHHQLYLGLSLLSHGVVIFKIEEWQHAYQQYWRAQWIHPHGVSWNDVALLLNCVNSPTGGNLGMPVVLYGFINYITATILWMRPCTNSPRAGDSGKVYGCTSASTPVCVAASQY